MRCGVLFWVVACGPVAGPGVVGTDSAGGSEDTGAPEDASSSSSTGEPVVEPDLACRRGTRVGCLPVTVGEPDVCLCRGQVLVPRDRPYWGGGAVQDGFALWGTDPDEDGAYSLSFWRASGSELVLEEARAVDHLGGGAETFVAGRLAATLGTAHVVIVEEEDVWVEDTLPGDRDGLGLSGIDGNINVRLAGVGDFDADGVADLAVISPGSTYLLWQRLGGPSSTSHWSLGFGSSAFASYAFTLCDVDGDGASDFVSAAEGYVVFGQPGHGLDPSDTIAITPLPDADTVRCTDLDGDGRDDLLVTLEPKSAEAGDAYGATATLYQDGGRVFGDPVVHTGATPPHEFFAHIRGGVQPVGWLGEGRDLVAIVDGHWMLARAIADRVYGEARTRELPVDLTLAATYDVDDDGRQELIAFDYETDEVAIYWPEIAGP